MPRIPLLNERQVGWFTRLAYGLARRRFGQVPEPFQAAANHRRLMWAGGVHELLVEQGPYMIALEHMRARTNHALGITAQGYTSDDARPIGQVSPRG